MALNGYIKYKYYIIAAVMTAIHGGLSFLTDRIIFVSVTSLNWKTYCLNKVLFLVLLYLFYQFVVRSICTWKDKSASSEIFRLFLAYLVILLIAAVWTWPLNITTGDIQYLAGAGLTLQPLWFLHYFTTSFYILGFMLFPSISGVVLLEILIQALVCGYLIFRIKRRWGRNRAKFFSVIFILPPVIFYGIYANRLPVYSVLLVFLIGVLWLDAMEDNQAGPLKIFVLLLISAVLSCWRTEGIWLVLFAPLLIVWAYQFKQKSKMYVFLWLSLVSIRFVISIPQDLNTVWLNPDYNHGRMAPFYEYTFTTMQYVGLDDQKNKKLLENIDCYLDLEKVHQLSETMGDSIFREMLYEAKRSEATAADYITFTNAVEKIILDNPIVFIKTKLAVFNYTALNQYPFVGNCKSEQVNGDVRLMGENADKTLHMVSSTPTILRYLFNIIFSGVNLPMKGTAAKIISMIFRLPYNLYIPVIILLVSGISALYKRNIFEVLLVAGILIHGGIVLIMAPAAYFMYYYPVYLVGYIIAGVKILNIKKNGDIYEAK